MEELLQLLEDTANMLRGMAMDPAIPAHAKEAMRSRIAELERAVTENLDGAQRTSSGATGMTRSGMEGVPLERRVRRLPAKVERRCPRCGRHAYHWLMANGSPAALTTTKMDTAACANCGHHWPCRVMEKDL